MTQAHSTQFVQERAQLLAAQAPALDSAATPLDMFYHWEALKPDAVYLRQPQDGAWRDLSWRQVGDEARRVARALQNLVPERGSRIGILADNCAHWIIADLAIMMGGYASAPAFTSMSGSDVRYVLEHSTCRVLLVGQTQNWSELEGALPEGITVIALPVSDCHSADMQWHELLEAYAPLPGQPRRDGGEELTTIYTSGSTGLPKGVVHTFAGAGHAARNVGTSLRMGEDDRLISYLPLAHAFERAAVDFLSLYAGCSIGFNERQSSFADDMRTVRPTVFQCVPRLWTKFKESVLANCGGQAALDAALADADRADGCRQDIRQRLGLDAGRVLLTGSAPTPMALHHWYEKLGMPLCEIYGQSEVISGTVNLPWDRKPGTLGKATANTDLRIGEQGEILIRAKAAMQRYLHEPAQTRDTLVNGWIHTGDMGRIDEDGFLSLTGRLKDIFKTARGKYVAPAPIEALFTSTAELEQLCLVGSGLDQTVLLAQLSDAGRALAPEAVAKRIRQAVLTVNEAIPSYSRIAVVLIVDGDWHPGSGLITHTLKIKRAAIEAHYRGQVELAFTHVSAAASPVVLWERDLSQQQLQGC